MCIVFTCGEHTFRREVEGYEGIVCRCFNCGNYSGHVIKSHPWFTFCFVPVVPLSIHGYHDVVCHICNFAQPLEHRPDVQAMRHGGNGAGAGAVPLQQQQQQQQPPPVAHGAQPPPQGWGSPGPGDQQSAWQQPKPNQEMRYG